MKNKPLIEIKGLTKWYKNATQPAVNKLNLTINRGEIFGLLGPNGAGKTTTISILCTQINSSEGTVIIDGFDLKKDANQIKKIIGIVPQDIALYPTLTARENLDFFGHMYGLHGKELDEKIRQCMHDFGLEDKMDKKIKTFSGGMKRRVNLIAGILHNPRILILDEPTVGIDVQSKIVILEHLKNMNKTNGITIIYTSHLMEEAEQFCSHIAIIDEGKLIEEGNPKKLIEKYDNCNNLEDIFLHLTGKRLRD